MRWTDEQIRSALGLGSGGAAPVYDRISTDTRTLAAGDLFVALVGERFDGHDYLSAAAAAGARGAVVRRGTAPVEGLTLYPMDDPLRAYGRLARARRRRVSGPVVAITGTNGKTSTKEMLAATLRTRYRTHATRANLNNLVGVPQTILEAPDGVEALVVEAGANLPGEIARYREIIEPDLTVITNVAAGHLEGFGSLDGVRAEKLALARDVAVVVVGGGDPALAAGARSAARRTVVAGLEADADVRPERVDSVDGRSRITIDGMSFTLKVLGRHQARNAVLAWAVGRELGLDPERVARALEAVTIPGGRGELVTLGDVLVLNDSYNANPASFRAAIELADAIRGARRLVFVAGSMLELGAESAARHAEIAELLVALRPDVLAGVGAFAPALEAHRVALGDRLVVAPDATTMGPLLATRLRGGELVVLKGSRGVALERMLPLLATRTVHPD